MTAVGDDSWYMLLERVVLVLVVGLSSSSVRMRAKQALKAMTELYKRKAQMRIGTKEIVYESDAVQDQYYVYLGAYRIGKSYRS